MNDIEKLVSELPEVYQKIYGHPELSGNTSRLCEDREQYIVQIVGNLQKKLGRKNLKVLDIGCAQGYFSLTLAKLGCMPQDAQTCPVAA
jgi:O-antigen chain-terminating methyltransferase